MLFSAANIRDPEKCFYKCRTLIDVVKIFHLLQADKVRLISVPLVNFTIYFFMCIKCS